MMDMEELSDSIKLALGRRNGHLYFRAFIEEMSQAGLKSGIDEHETYLSYLHLWAEGKAKIPVGKAREVMVSAIEHALALALFYHEKLEEL